MNLAFDIFMKYKIKVPVCGAIILNSDMTKVLLVRGWKSNASWGFPKGKMNQDEAETSCAIREVFEETGFDSSAYVRDQEFLERRIYEQRVRLYMVAGIDESVEFLTQTKKEIGDIKWHSLNSIPGFLKNSAVSDEDFIHSKNKKYKFYMITPFIASIRKWISKFKSAQMEGKDRSRAGLQVTMDEEEMGNDSDADLLNQAVSEQHHYFFQQQNPYSDQYSSAIVPQTQRVEMEGSLKSLLGMGGGIPSQTQNHFTSQPVNIPMSHHQIPQAYPPHGSFPLQAGPFGSFGHGPSIPHNLYFPQVAPGANPMQMMGPPFLTTSIPNVKSEKSPELIESPKMEHVKEPVVASEKSVKKSDSIDSSISALPVDSSKKSEKNPLLELLVGDGGGGVSKLEKKLKKNEKSQQDQKALLDLLCNPTPSPIAESIKDKIASPKKSTKEKVMVVDSTPVSSSDDVKKSPKKKKKEKAGVSEKSNEKMNHALQFGAVQILKRPTSEVASKESQNVAKPVVGSSQKPVMKIEKKDPIAPPAIRTTRQESSSQLLEIIHSSRKNSAAENQSLLDALFHGAAPKSISDDPGLEMALSGRTLSRSSSIASARITSPQPGQLTKERPSLVDILKGVPLPPPTQQLDYARSLSPTSPKVRPPSPEKPSFSKRILTPKSLKNGLLDILISGSETMKSSPTTQSPFSPQQSLVDILQGIPKPPGHSNTNNGSLESVKEQNPSMTPASHSGIGSLTDAFTPNHPSVVTSTSNTSLPPPVIKKEGKNSLMDILLGGFSSK